MDREVPHNPAPPAPIGLFRARRERLLARLGDGVALVAAAPELLRSGDTEVRYRPNPDLYYLTGFHEPEAVAVITPHGDHRFVLFLRARDPEREAWSGRRTGVEAAAERLGADAAHPISELRERLPDLLRPAGRVLSNLGVDRALDRRVMDLLVRARRARQRTGVGPAAWGDLETLTGPMRRVKDAHELERMRAAAAITVRGHLAALERARPGAGEWEVEAALESTFRALGATGPAFPTIVGSGVNGTILHYTRNDRRIEAGDLVLVDAGAEWGMYCSDATRTFPASGRFTPPQREIHDLVLAAERAGIDAARPGAPVSAPHDAAVRVLVDGLLRVGLLSGSADQALEERTYRKLYMHQTSHWLGLDVHDAGLYREEGEDVRLEAGMVLTVEPGLYLPHEPEVPERFRGIGVRIEDSVLVTEAGREVLTAGVPVEAGEVEALATER